MLVHCKRRADDGPVLCLQDPGGREPSRSEQLPVGPVERELLVEPCSKPKHDWGNVTISPRLNKLFPSFEALGPTFQECSSNASHP